MWVTCVMPLNRARTYHQGGNIWVERFQKAVEASHSPLVGQTSGVLSDATLNNVYV